MIHRSSRATIHQLKQLRRAGTDLSSWCLDAVECSSKWQHSFSSEIYERNRNVRAKLEEQSKLSKSDQMEEGTTEHLFVPQVQTLLHYILGWLLFSSYVLVFYSESLEINDIACTSGYKTSRPFNFNLMEIHSAEFTPVGFTFKMVMCDQPKRHHKGKFLKEENVLVYYLGFRKCIRHDGIVKSVKGPVPVGSPHVWP